MELLGSKNWWMPKWLDRMLPRISVEGVDDLDVEAETPDAGESVPPSPPASIDRQPVRV
jgi:putative drug exporter of the RND superfamily